MFSFIRPEFFDIFGLGTFLFLSVFSIWGLKTKKPPPKWALILILVIGIAGLIVDGSLVWLAYLR